MEQLEYFLRFYVYESFQDFYNEKEVESYENYDENDIKILESYNYIVMISKVYEIEVSPRYEKRITKK